MLNRGVTTMRPTAFSLLPRVAALGLLVSLLAGGLALRAEDHLAAAAALMAEGRHLDAFEHYARAAALDPASQPAQEGLGKARMLLREQLGAIPAERVTAMLDRLDRLEQGRTRALQEDLDRQIAASQQAERRIAALQGELAVALATPARGQAETVAATTGDAAGLTARIARLEDEKRAAGERIAALERDLATARAEGERAHTQVAALEQERQRLQAAATAATAAPEAAPAPVAAVEAVAPAAATPADGRLNTLRDNLAALAEASEAVRQGIGTVSAGEGKVEAKMHGLIAEDRSAAETLADLKARLARIEQLTGG